jgi:hypothetical protein
MQQREPNRCDLAVLRRMSQHFNQRSAAATWRYCHGIAVRLKEMNEVRNYIRNQFGKVFAEKTRVRRDQESIAHALARDVGSALSSRSIYFETEPDSTT